MTEVNPPIFNFPNLNYNPQFWTSSSSTSSLDQRYLQRIGTPTSIASLTTFTGQVKKPTSSLSDNSTEVATTAYVKGQGYTTISTILSNANSWLNTNVFNSFLPTSTITTTTSTTQIAPIAILNTLYGQLASAATNNWASNNTFNTNLPTSTIATTTGGTQFLTRNLNDSRYGRLGNSITNTWNSINNFTGAVTTTISNLLVTNTANFTTGLNIYNGTSIVLGDASTTGSIYVANGSIFIDTEAAVSPLPNFQSNLIEAGYSSDPVVLYSQIVNSISIGNLGFTYNINLNGNVSFSTPATLDASLFTNFNPDIVNHSDGILNNVWGGVDSYLTNSGGASALGINNTAYGLNTLTSSTDGANNTAFGLNASQLNTAGSRNTSFGVNSNASNLVGNDNTAFGYGSLASNTGSNCVAVGSQALQNNTGTGNIGIGFKACNANTSALYNIGIGYNALLSNTLGNFNLALGYEALKNCNGNGTTGVGWANYALGYNAMNALTTGAYNVCLGNGCMTSASFNGSFNTGVGRACLQALTTGTYNTCIGYTSGISNITTGIGNTLIGSLTTCNGNYSNSTVIGYNASNTIGNNAIILGTASETTYIAGNLNLTGTFTGTISTATTATNITTTTDNSATTCYIPFSKTTAGISTALYLDDTTGPLSYQPSTSTLTALIFSGSLSGNATSSTNATNIISGTTNIQQQSQYVHSSFTLTTAATLTITAPFYEIYPLAPTANMTITLPAAAAAYIGVRIQFRRTGGTTTVTVVSATSNIYPNNSLTLTNSILAASTYTAVIYCTYVTTTTYAWFLA